MLIIIWILRILRIRNVPCYTIAYLFISELRIGCVYSKTTHMCTHTEALCNYVRHRVHLQETAGGRLPNFNGKESWRRWIGFLMKKN